jgi:hypothetical protein
VPCRTCGRSASPARDPGRITSAESFFSLAPQAVLAILEQLEVPVSGIHVIAYVRQPVSMYLSLNQQKIKANHNIYKPDKYRRDIAAPFERWSEVGLCRSIHVGLFEARALANGSVVADFAGMLSQVTGQTGLDPPDRRAQRLIRSPGD